LKAAFGFGASRLNIISPGNIYIASALAILNLSLQAICFLQSTNGETGTWAFQSSRRKDYA
jgi:hypothetical protein